MVPNESFGQDVSNNSGRSVARRTHKAPWPSKVMSLPGAIRWIRSLCAVIPANFGPSVTSLNTLLLTIGSN